MDASERYVTAQAPVARLLLQPRLAVIAIAPATPFPSGI